MSPSDRDPISYLKHVVVPDVMSFCPVTLSLVLNVVLTLKDVSAGLDDISTKLVKAIIPSILTHVTHLVNLCLSVNIFPDILKTALITPVFKAGSRAHFTNYRPISVISVFFL